MKAWQSGSEYAFDLSDGVSGKAIAFGGDVWIEFSQFDIDSDALDEKRLRFLLNVLKTAKKANKASEEAFPDMEKD